MIHHLAGQDVPKTEKDRKESCLSDPVCRISVGQDLPLYGVPSLAMLGLSLAGMEDTWARTGDDSILHC